MVVKIPEILWAITKPGILQLHITQELPTLLELHNPLELHYTRLHILTVLQETLGTVFVNKAVVVTFLHQDRAFTDLLQAATILHQAVINPM